MYLTKEEKAETIAKIMKVPQLEAKLRCNYREWKNGDPSIASFEEWAYDFMAWTLGNVEKPDGVTAVDAAYAAFSIMYNGMPEVSGKLFVAMERRGGQFWLEWIVKERSIRLNINIEQKNREDLESATYAMMDAIKGLDNSWVLAEEQYSNEYSISWLAYECPFTAATVKQFV